MVKHPPQSPEQEKKLGRVLITGSKGTIGSLLVCGLTEKFEIVGLDIKGDPNQKTEFIADISNKAALETVFDAMGHVDFIIHLAASADENAPWEEVLENNLIGTAY